MLLASVHGDHIGDPRATGPSAGTCANPATTPAANTTTAEVVAVKSSTLVAGGEMADFVAAKIEEARGGRPTPSCRRSGSASSPGRWPERFWLAVAGASTPARVTRGELTTLVLIGCLDARGGTARLATTTGLVGDVSVLGSLYRVTTLVLAQVLVGERLS